MSLSNQIYNLLLLFSDNESEPVIEGSSANPPRPEHFSFPIKSHYDSISEGRIPERHGIAANKVPLLQAINMRNELSLWASVRLDPLRISYLTNLNRNHVAFSHSVGVAISSAYKAPILVQRASKAKGKIASHLVRP